MDANRKRGVVVSVLLAVLLAVIGLPILLLSFAWVEERIIGTFYIAEFCRQLGIFDEVADVVQKFREVF